MANNLIVKDASNTTQTVKTTDTGGVHVPHHNIDTLPALPAGSNTIGNVGLTGTVPLPTGAATAAKQPALGTAGSPSADVLTMQGIAGGTPLTVGGTTVQSTGTFTRPADTTAYAANDAVNNSTSAPAAVAIANVARIAAGSGIILTGRLVKSTTAAAASGFRLWLYTGSPSGTLANDNAAFSINAANKAVRLGYIDFVTQVTGSDCVEFYGAPVTTGGLPFKLPSGTTVYGLLQSLGAYTPGNAEVFDLYLTVVQD